MPDPTDPQPDPASSAQAIRAAFTENLQRLRAGFAPPQKIQTPLPEIGIKLDPQQTGPRKVGSTVSRVWAHLFGRTSTGHVMIGAGREGGLFVRHPDWWKATHVAFGGKNNTTAVIPGAVVDYWEFGGVSDDRPTLWALTDAGVDRARLAPDTLSGFVNSAGNDVYCWTKKIWAQIPQIRVQATNPVYEYLALGFEPEVV